MINAEMREYTFSTLGATDAYGQAQATEAKGTIKISIYLYSQSNTDNIRYKDATYIGFTSDKAIDDNYIINYGKERLKVLYINPKGRLKQVYLKEML